MSETVFCTLATGNYYEKGGTANLVKSAKKFHPNIPFIVFGDEEITKLLSTYQQFIEQSILLLPPEIRPKPPYPTPPMNFYHSLIGGLLCQSYDLVIYIDCDSLITAPLDEVFNSDYEVAGVRNNADNGKAGCMTPVLEGSLDVFKYVNAGFTASRSKSFWSSWALLNHKLNFYAPMSEQYTLNILFHSSMYKTLLLDPPYTNVHYGISSTYGKNTHWDSWQNITIEDNLLKLNGKTIKILHEAGGSAIPKMSLDENSKLPKHICQWIKETICNT